MDTFPFRHQRRQHFYKPSQTRKLFPDSGAYRRNNDNVFTIDEVQAELQMLFEKQYILTQTVEVEVRYRTETRTDSEGNDYDVEVPYNYYICNVKLENFDLSHVPVYIMDEETLSLYAVYMATLGNREDLFPGSGYVDKYTKPCIEDYFGIQIDRYARVNFYSFIDIFKDKCKKKENILLQKEGK